MTELMCPSVIILLAAVTPVIKCHPEIETVDGMLFQDYTQLQTVRHSHTAHSTDARLHGLTALLSLSSNSGIRSVKPCTIRQPAIIGLWASG